MEDTQELKVAAYDTPFPHIIVKDFYNEKELELIWEELRFYTHPGKLLEAKNYGGIVDYTESKAVVLDQVYRDYTFKAPSDVINGNPNFRPLSSILTVTRKIFGCGILDVFADIHDCCSIANKANWDTHKVRYYHNGESYNAHTDKSMQFLAFYYTHKEPKKFTGGEVYFPKYDYEYGCDNNSIIIFPGWVEHGVREVKIENSDYYDGWGRYAVTTFFGSITDRG